MCRVASGVDFLYSHLTFNQTIFTAQTYILSIKECYRGLVFFKRFSQMEQHPIKFQFLDKTKRWIHIKQDSYYNDGIFPHVHIIFKQNKLILNKVWWASKEGKFKRLGWFMIHLGTFHY